MGFLRDLGDVFSDTFGVWREAVDVYADAFRSFTQPLPRSGSREVVVLRAGTRGSITPEQSRRFHCIMGGSFDTLDEEGKRMILLCVARGLAYLVQQRWDSGEVITRVGVVHVDQHTWDGSHCVVCCGAR